MENYKFTQYEGDEMAALFEKIDELDAATPSKTGLMSSTDKSKLDNIASNAQVNVLEGVQVAGIDLSISEKKVNIPVDNAPTEGSSALVRSGGVAAALAAINQFRYQVVETLPTASADTMRIIYLVPSENPETENVKDEFITIDNGESADPRYTWEQIGSTAIDISGKADKDLDAVEGNLAKFDPNGNPVDSGIAAEKIDEIEGKITALGTSAGIAEGIADTISAGTAQEFTFRKSGGDGVNYMKRIKGKTLAWNQMAKRTDLLAISNATKTTIAQGEVLVTPTTNSANAQLYDNGDRVISGHKYFIIAFIKVATAGSYTFLFANWSTGGPYILTLAANTYTPLSAVVTATGNDYIGIAKRLNLEPFYVKDLQYFDLTLAGIADEISTPADFVALYPDIYPFNSGTLISNDAEAVETTGVNQWDEEWENGYYTGTEGEALVKAAQPNFIRCANLIKVMPSTAYNLHFGNIGGGYMVKEVDENGIVVKSTTASSSNLILTTDSRTRYIVWSISQLATYDNNICINLSNAAINGQYFPYWKRTLQLGLTTKKDTDGNVPFADGMKGAGTASDWANKVGGEKQMKRVKFSDLSWDYSSALGFFFVLVNGSKVNALSTTANATCSAYPTGITLADSAVASAADKTLRGYSGAAGFVVRDTSYTSVAGFLADHGNDEIDYELATPVPFTWAEPLPNAILVDSAGTEQAVYPVHEDGTPSAPFKCDSNYSISIKNLLAKLSE